ncbi:MAG: ABC transporter ATP-binding protein [Promethearchaeota archaeon]
MAAIIHLDNIWEKYHKSIDFALKDISLTFYKGEIHVILGPNGSGKSTLLKILAHLLPTSKGKIKYLDSQLKKSNNEFKREIGVLFDHTAHWDQLTGYENAWFFASSYGIHHDDINSQLEYYFKWINLWDKKDDPVKTYSYGMRRKLALIEALVHYPKILLFDEPSMGLDYHSRIILYSTLKKLALEGITIIITSNDVNEAAFLANKVSMLSNGKLIASGNPGKLMESLKLYIRIELRLTLPIPLDGLKKIENIEEIEVENNSQNNDFIIIILAKPQKISNYSIILADIVNEIVSKNGQIKFIDIKSPNLGDLFLKLKGEEYVP